MLFRFIKIKCKKKKKSYSCNWFATEWSFLLELSVLRREAAMALATEQKREAVQKSISEYQLEELRAESEEDDVRTAIALSEVSLQTAVALEDKSDYFLEELRREKDEVDLKTALLISECAQLTFESEYALAQMRGTDVDEETWTRAAPAARELLDERSVRSEREAASDYQLEEMRALRVRAEQPMDQLEHCLDVAQSDYVLPTLRTVLVI